MGNFWLSAVKPSPSGAAILAACVVFFRQQLSRTSWPKLVALFLLFLNRNNLPLRWHVKFMATVLRARVRYDLARLGIKKPDQRQRLLGIKGGEAGLPGIGRNLFDLVAVRKGRVSFSESDYNLHLSNSLYAQAGDFARMSYWSDYLGVAYTQDGVATALGGTSFVYYREIPMFTTYTTESRLVAFDDKWTYFLTRFVVPYDKRSKRPPAKSLEDGRDVTVCAYLLSRLCFKRGRLGLTPEKGFVLSGFVGASDTGADAGRNWALAKQLRREKRVKAWIQETGDSGQYIRGCEERNDKALSIIRRLHDADRAIWHELDQC